MLMTRQNPQTRPWRSWYDLGRWKKVRAHQLRKQPLCEQCLVQGNTTFATVADHVQEHQGRWNDFWFGSLQSLCRQCHELKHGRKKEIPQLDDDGWPIGL
jgi:hypothetical protein